MRRLVQHGADGFAVFGEVVTARATRRLGVGYRAGRLEKKIDGEPATGMAQLAELLPVHAIDPTMHALVEGGPSERRRFLDWGVFHVEPRYLEDWKRYRRVLEPAKRGAQTSGQRPRAAAVVDGAGGGGGGRRPEPARVSRPPDPAGGGLRPAAARRGRCRSSIDAGWPTEQPFEDALAAAELATGRPAARELGPHRAEVVLRLDERARAGRGVARPAKAHGGSADSGPGGRSRLRVPRTAAACRGRSGGRAGCASPSSGCSRPWPIYRLS